MMYMLLLTPPNQPHGSMGCQDLRLRDQLTISASIATLETFEMVKALQACYTCLLD